ncbi:hypothetical protein [Methylobacterium sp. D54C]|jgi:hypothetical protein
MWNPDQLALLREAGIAGNSISAGLAAIRKANYATPGLYGHAFFSFSVGLERMLKLIYIMAYLIENKQFPTDNHLRDLRHNIKTLFEHAQQIQIKYEAPAGESDVVAGSVEMLIVEFMSRFAQGTRYYNLDLLVKSKKAAASIDPIKDWFNTVGVPILDLHPTPKREQKIRFNAEIVHRATSEFRIVRHTAEDGTPLNDVFSASYHTGITEITRKYGNLYGARLCRYLYYTLWHMRHECHNHDQDVPYLDELFFPFMNDDAYLLSRRTFPPLSQ